VVGACVSQHRKLFLVEAGGAHGDDAGLAVGVGFDAEHFGNGVQRVARINWREKVALRVAEVRYSVQRDIRHGLAEHSVKDQQRIDRRAWQPAILRKAVGGEHGVARAGERDVERGVGLRKRSRRRVRDDLARREVFEKVAGVRFGHAVSLCDGAGVASTSSSASQPE
jgi:hypothetical protein